jgi:hypothetical protein
MSARRAGNFVRAYLYGASQGFVLGVVCTVGALALGLYWLVSRCFG